MYTKLLEEILKNEINLNIIIDKNDNSGMVYKNDIDTYIKMKIKDIIDKTMEKLKNHLLNFIDDANSDKLIIDLRGNPGGYLGSAVNIGSWFIDEGKTILSEDFGDSRKPVIYRSHGPRLFNDKLSLVVLVDGGSASASEILAGALKDNGIATLVGEKTFGKGSVQELVKITDDTSLKVTVANWLTPKGISISKQGIEPDVKVGITEKDFEAKKDPQMDKAVEILKAKQ